MSGEVIQLKSVSPQYRLDRAHVQDQLTAGRALAGARAPVLVQRQVRNESGALEMAGAEPAPQVGEVAQPQQAGTATEPVPAHPRQKRKVVKEPECAPQPPNMTPPPTRRSRVKITFESESLGRVTLFVDKIGVSKTLLLLFYPLDGETAIVEPPVGGMDKPILITHESKTYECFSGGFSAEVDGHLVVALPMITNEDR